MGSREHGKPRFQGTTISMIFDAFSTQNFKKLELPYQKSLLKLPFKMPKSMRKEILDLKALKRQTSSPMKTAWKASLNVLKVGFHFSFHRV